MKTIHLLMAIALLAFGCRQEPQKTSIANGFYEVLQQGSDTTQFIKQAHQLVIPFDTLFSPDERTTRILIDTTEYVPLELERVDVQRDEAHLNNALSVSLTPVAAARLKGFTGKRLMKRVAIVLEGKAITMHLIRDTITGPGVQITRCGDNACDYLYTKMKVK